MAKNRNRDAAVAKSSVVLFPQQPALQLIYDTAPIGLACLSPDCRYLQINQRLTEICGISIEDHLGRSVRDCVPALAEAVESIVQSIMDTGDPVTGIEVTGQRADQADERFWMTYWHPLRSPSGEIVAVSVAAEEITERKPSACTSSTASSRIVWVAGSISIVNPARERKFGSSCRGRHRPNSLPNSVLWAAQLGAWRLEGFNAPESGIRRSIAFSSPGAHRSIRQNRR